MTTLDTLYIDGAFVAGSGAPFDVVDPATEDVITSINAATPGDDDDDEKDDDDR